MPKFNGITINSDLFAEKVSKLLIAAQITTNADLNAAIDSLVDDTFPAASNQIKNRWKGILKILFSSVSFDQ